MAPSTPTIPTNPDLITALRAVHLASLLTKSHLLSHLSTDVSASTKSDQSEVTVADFASQAVIISIIHRAFPDDDFIAEESGEMLRGDEELRGRVWELVGRMAEVTREVGGDGDEGFEGFKSIEEMVDVIDLGQVGGEQKQDGGSRGGNGSGRTWILDPIDGTKTYIRGQQYVVCLCLVEDGEQKVAVLGCPNLSLEERGEDGRVKVEEELVDLKADGGWMVSCVKGEGVGMSTVSTPQEIRALEEVIGWVGEGESVEPNTTTTNINGDNDTTTKRPIAPILFTDSAASPHTSKPLHQTIFATFADPSTPLPITPLDIWSMQLKYILLTLRVSGADAMIRTPPTSDYHASVWDHAGGQLLLVESGGLLSDAEGKSFVVDGATKKLEGNWGVVAVRGGGFTEGRKKEVVHAKVVAVVKAEVERRRREEGEQKL